ncbi:MAG: GlcNAc-PI de-N-acetylase [Anaerolineae bacterium]|nr:MAG: GlcNAc-PI de-N-acetylase [Anaerolineae bacterium]
MTETQTTPPVILAVLAHPDDESFGMGGTLAHYANRGAAVHLICATRGEVGEVAPEHLQGYQSIAELREDELRCAARHLKLRGLYFLDYRDSGMPGSPENEHPQALAAQPVEEVARKVARYIRELRPDVVLTFDPIGGYKHPDHIAIHKATVRAFHLAADPAFECDLPPWQARKLYFHLIPKNFLKVGVFLLRLFGKDPRKFGQNGDIDLQALVEEGDFPAHAVVDYRDAAAQKEAASHCHASQGGVQMSRGVMGWFRRLVGNKDYFMRAYPPPTDGRRERDLLA